MQTGKKRKLFVKPSFQIQAAVKVALVQVPCILLTGLVMSIFYLFYMDPRMYGVIDLHLIAWMAVSVVVIMGGVVFYTVRHTRSILGPVYKTGSVLKGMAMGELPGGRVAFRNTDEFRELSTDLNGLIDRMRIENESKRSAMERLNSLKKGLDRNTVDLETCHLEIEAIEGLLLLPAQGLEN